MRILLVDDDTAVIQTLLAILKTLPGHDLRVATGGEKALENASALGGLDLLISDVVMEPINGFTLRDELVSRYPNVRTILISGYDLSDYPEQLAGHTFLAKPINATHRFCDPVAMPTATANITNAVSRVSRTTVRKRTIDSAPTRLNARATLSPITCVTIAIRTHSKTSVVGSDAPPSAPFVVRP